MAYIRIKKDLPEKHLKEGDILEIGDHLLKGGIVVETDSTGIIYLDGTDYDAIPLSLR